MIIDSDVLSKLSDENQIRLGQLYYWIDLDKSVYVTMTRACLNTSTNWQLVTVICDMVTLKLDADVKEMYSKDDGSEESRRHLADRSWTLLKNFLDFLASLVFRKSQSVT